MILLITGSSASGKTTIGNVLVKKHGFKQLDGDQLIKDLGLKGKSWNKIHEQIFEKSLSMHANGNVVITHVVLPDKFALYQEFYKDKKILFHIIALKPERSTLFNRNKTRTCHPKTTPVEVINFFCDKFDELDKHEFDVCCLDNEKQTPEETVEKIANRLELKVLRL